MCRLITLSHMDAVTFPDEILDTILRASWPGLRLGLTCRRLRAQITDDQLDRWAQPVVGHFTDQVFLGGVVTREAIHHELPNGTFHGPANIGPYYTFTYRRGQMASGLSMNTRDMCSYFYHKNMLVAGKTNFCSKDMTLCINSGTMIFDGKSWNLGAANPNRATDPVARYENMLPKIRDLVGDRFERHVNASENRPKIPVFTTFAEVAQWPDCRI